MQAIYAEYLLTPEEIEEFHREMEEIYMREDDAVNLMIAAEAEVAREDLAFFNI